MTSAPPTPERSLVGPVVGIDIGGTHMQIGVVDDEGGILSRRGIRTESARGAEDVLDRLAVAVTETASEARLTMADIHAIGIAAAGAIDIPRGVVLVAPNLGWRDLAVRELVAARLQRPVVLENDVNGATWGEHLLGAGKQRGAADALGIWVGTGVGGGLIIGNRIHHGALFTAGEVGHVVVEPGAAPGRRTIEDLCSRTGMRTLVLERLADHPSSQLHELAADPQRIGTRELKAAYDAGDEAVCPVIDRAADLLGVVIANHVTMLAIDTVYVGGGITETFGAPYLDRIRRSFRAQVFPEQSGDACELIMTELAADAGLLGAAMLARGA